MSGTSFRVVAGVLPKLEALGVAELQRLGLGPKFNTFRGGIEFRATTEELWRVAQQARVIEFLRVRTGQRAPAHDWGELYHRVVAVPWSAYLRRGSKGRLPSVSVSCDASSKLYHEGAVRDRVVATIGKRLGVTRQKAPAGTQDGESRDTTAGPGARRRARRAAEAAVTANAEPEGAVPGQYRGAYSLEHSSHAPAVHDVFVHVDSNRVQLSVNASGELLHKRGYRRHAVGSPIRETLGTACLRMAAAEIDRSHGGDGTSIVCPPPVWDPFCGSGTLVLEALDAHAGLLGPLPRRFAFEFWPTHDAEAYARYVADLHAAHQRSFQSRIEALPSKPVFIGSDIAGRSVRAARANFDTALSTSPDDGSPEAADRRRALRAATKFVRGDFVAVEPTVPRGATIVTNVPYGHRTSSGESFSRLYRRFGGMLASRPDLENVFVLTKHPTFRRDTGLKWRQVKSFRNGGLTVEWLQLVR